MKKLLTLPFILALSGCLGNFSSDGIYSTLGATGGAVIGTVVAGPGGGVVGGLLGGVTTDAVTEPAVAPDPVVDLPPEEQVEVLKNREFWMFVESLSIWLIGAVVFVFFILPIGVGYLMPNREHRKLKEMAFDNPDIKMKDFV